MATYIKTLKEDNGDITYPQTKAGAVLLDNGSDLETELSQHVTAEDIASTSALTPPVQTNMIADGAVTSDKIDWTTFEYSTSPVVVGTWIDGKTIYRRVYNFGALPNSNTKDIEHGIINLDRVINIWGWAFRPSDQTRCPLPFINVNTLALGITLGPVTPTLIRLTCGSNRTDFTESYIIMDYTTTD